MAQQTFDCGDRAARRERGIRLAELAASADNLGCRAQAPVKAAVKEAAKQPEWPPTGGSRFLPGARTVQSGPSQIAGYSHLITNSYKGILTSIEDRLCKPDMRPRRGSHNLAAPHLGCREIGPGVPDEACRTPRSARDGTEALIEGWRAATRRLQAAAVVVVEMGSLERVTRAGRDGSLRSGREPSDEDIGCVSVSMRPGTMGCETR